MKSRIAIAAAVLLHLFALTLDAQLPQATAQTRQQLTKALQESREKKDRHGEAIALLKLGIAEVELGNVNGARSNLTEAVEKMRAQNDVVGAWMSLVLLAQIELAAGSTNDAIARIERAFTVLNEAKASTAPLTLKTFTALGAGPALPPEMAQMLDDPRTASLVKTMMIQYSFEPMTHDAYGSVLTQVGQFDKAEAELKAAVAGSVMAQGMYDFPIQWHFGDLRFRQQRYDEARTHYVKALNASTTNTAMLAIGDDQIKANIYDRLIRLETLTGHPEEAKRWAEKAKQLVRKPADAR